MTIGTGQVSILDVVQEHGGYASNASLSNYYRGGISHYIHPNNNSIPTSGPISLTHFRGTSRFGYYPLTSGAYWNAGANVAQYGWNPQYGQGVLSFNNRYRGYTFGFILWQSDGTIQIAMNGANIPQGILSAIWTPTYGWVNFTGYVANFFGSTVWNVYVGGTNPFPAGAIIEPILL